MKRMILLALAATILVGVFPVTSLAYNANAAITYADTYAEHPNTNYKYYMRDGQPEDCTNFVSQRLFRGGLSTDSQWWCNVKYLGDRLSQSNSNEWSVADSLKNYLKDSGRAIKIGSWSQSGSPAPYVTYPYVNNSGNLSTQIVGRVVLFYDWNCDGSIDHAAFFVVNNGRSTDSREGGTGDLIDQHTDNRYHVFWRPDFRQKGEIIKNTRIYAFQLF